MRGIASHFTVLWCVVKQGPDLIDLRQLLEGCSFWGFGLFLAIVLVFLAIETRWQKIKKPSGFFKVKLKSAIWASEWPRRSNWSSDLKFLTQIAYDSMLNLALRAFRNSFWNFDRRWNGQLLDLRSAKAPQVKIEATRCERWIGIQRRVLVTEAWWTVGTLNGCCYVLYLSSNVKIILSFCERICTQFTFAMTL